MVYSTGEPEAEENSLVERRPARLEEEDRVFRVNKEELAAQVDLSHNDILANRLHGVSVHMVRTQISNCTIAENEGYAVYI